MEEEHREQDGETAQVSDIEADSLFELARKLEVKDRETWEMMYL